MSARLAEARATTNEQRLALVVDLANQLPPRQAAVVLARTKDGQSFEDIGTRLGIKASTARATFRDGIKHLRQIVDTKNCGNYTTAVHEHLDKYSDWYVMLSECVDGES
jgi:DNA-directed RNA polymerase specialized sigma24 family protein